MAKKKNDIDLQTAIQELEKIIDELNENDLDIDESIKKFKYGAELVKICRNKLKKAENEFIKIKKDLEI